MIAQVGTKGKPGCLCQEEAPQSGGGGCTSRRQCVLTDSKASLGMWQRPGELAMGSDGIYVSGRL